MADPRARRARLDAPVTDHGRHHAIDELRLRVRRVLDGLNDAGAAGDDGFDAVIAGDLAARRAAVDALDEGPLVADRAGLLIVHPDGNVEATLPAAVAAATRRAEAAGMTVVGITA